MLSKEQAIEYLKADIKHWENTSVSTEHLEMAIKALEQQPSDCKIFGHKENCFGGADCKNCDYKIQALNQPTSDDCVSRAEVDRLCFRYLKPNTDDNIAFYEHFCDLQSVTPAIPTCDDCVSRQALINSYNGIETPVGYRKVVDMQVIEDLPPVTPTQRWIPLVWDEYPTVDSDGNDDYVYAVDYSVPMPKEDEWVLVTDENHNVVKVQYDGYDFGDYARENILAWQPLPLSYQGE